ncbi:hypothetical protein B4Q13_24400, partial [Lacticaseibacillus rhamnosus]
LNFLYVRTSLDLVAWIQENRATLPVAVITAHGNVESAVRALKLWFALRTYGVTGIQARLRTHIALAQMLIGRGANVNVADWFGETPLWAAVPSTVLTTKVSASVPSRSNMARL